MESWRRSGRQSFDGRTGELGRRRPYRSLYHLAAERGQFVCVAAARCEMSALCMLICTAANPNSWILEQEPQVGSSSCLVEAHGL